MISINARKTSPDTIFEASFSYLSEKTWTGSFSKRRGSTPASVAASGKRERRAKRGEESVREWKRKRTTQKGRRKGGERSREDESKERRDELGLILPPQSGAASDSICFKYMDRGVWAQDAMVGRDATRKRERERIQYPISYARTTPPDVNVRQREEKRKSS